MQHGARMGGVYAKSPAQQALLCGAIAFLLRWYLRCYRQLRPTTRQEISAWGLPVTAARLSEHIPQEEQHLLAMAARLAVQADTS